MLAPRPVRRRHCGHGQRPGCACPLHLVKVPRRTRPAARSVPWVWVLGGLRFGLGGAAVAAVIFDLGLCGAVSIPGEVGRHRPLTAHVDVSEVGTNTNPDALTTGIDGQLGDLHAGHARDLDVGGLPTAVPTLGRLLVRPRYTSTLRCQDRKPDVTVTGRPARSRMACKHCTSATEMRARSSKRPPLRTSSATVKLADNFLDRTVAPVSYSGRPVLLGSQYCWPGPSGPDATVSTSPDGKASPATGPPDSASSTSAAS